MSHTIQHIPTSAIDEAALVRDRLHVEPGALEALVASIAEDGLRMPIEVFALDEAKDGRTWGLISGFRRLAAVRALEARGVAGHDAIAAIVRQPADMATALALMVEENEIREEVSPWDRGLVLSWAAGRYFETVDAAIEALYPQADRMKRTRLRACARAAGELEWAGLVAPHRFTLEEVMRIAAACRAGFGEAIEVAAREVFPKDWERQREAILPVLAEAEGAGPEDGQAACRVAQLRPQLVVRRAKVKGGWSFRFTGMDATWMLMETVFHDLEAAFGVR